MLHHVLEYQTRNTLCRAASAITFSQQPGITPTPLGRTSPVSLTFDSRGPRIAASCTRIPNSKYIMQSCQCHNFLTTAWHHPAPSPLPGLDRSCQSEVWQLLPMHCCVTHKSFKLKMHYTELQVQSPSLPACHKPPPWVGLALSVWRLTVVALALLHHVLEYQTRNTLCRTASAITFSQQPGITHPLGPPGWINFVSLLFDSHDSCIAVSCTRVLDSIYIIQSCKWHYYLTQPVNTPPNLSLIRIEVLRYV